jgi:hypothetical protein
MSEPESPPALKLLLLMRTWPARTAAMAASMKLTIQR